MYCHKIHVNKCFKKRKKERGSTFICADSLSLCYVPYMKLVKIRNKLETLRNNKYSPDIYATCPHLLLKYVTDQP
jgi:hypothetical protein